MRLRDCAMILNLLLSASTVFNILPSTFIEMFSTPSFRENHFAYLLASCSLSPVCCSCFSFSFNSFSFFVFHRIITFFKTDQLLLCTTFFTLTTALRPSSYRFVCDTRATHCPCQLKPRPISSTHTHMSMVYTPLFTSSLTNVSSRLSEFYSCICALLQRT